jgi:triosephosphate isomerase (TIM)
MQTMRWHAGAPVRAVRAQAARAARSAFLRSSPCSSSSPSSSSSTTTTQPTSSRASLLGLGGAQRRSVVQCAASTGKFFVGGNWKCNGTHASVEKLVSELNAAAAAVPSDVDVVVAPPFLFIDWVRANIKAPFQVRG